MLKEVEACTSIAQRRQRKKKSRLLYSIPKELFKSRMRRSNVVPSFNADHGDTSRTLNFQRSDI
jgi:hypothetical protein